MAFSASNAQSEVHYASYLKIRASSFSPSGAAIDLKQSSLPESYIKTIVP
jgi:hypothetical protein